jgi:predicted 3-demethylubiquinone-9 3-methyltransferase (glyoxalase superfamily)
MSAMVVATHLWFKGNAREAVEFYVTLLPGSRIVEALQLRDAGPNLDTSYEVLSFELAGQLYLALNKSPFEFTPATSISVTCETQSEIDRLWNALLYGGVPQQCGWLTDRFGLCWQITPSILPTMVCEDSENGRRAMKAMLSMVKLEIAPLVAAYNGN